MLIPGNCKPAAGLGSVEPKFWPAQSADFTSTRGWISPAWAGLICLAVLGFAQSAHAEGPNSSYSAVRAAPFPATVAELGRNQQVLNDGAFSVLADFVQAIDAEQPKLASLKETKNPHPQFDESAFAALREYAQKIGVDRPNSIGAPRLKVAEAGSLLEFLQERGAGKPTPSTTPIQPRTTVPRPDRAVINATYVGEKVCMTCHASHAAEFGKTLMGRIGKTQPGKFACENCHGPGSAHVAKGGGRGVGGIISFRPNDLSRTAEENNAICLNCHQKGNRTHWTGSTHEERGLMCTNCHTIMKNVSRKSQLKTAFQPDTCFQCHKDRRVSVYRSGHMPIREGKVACSDCHNPHGSVTEALLKKDSVNEVCYTCHAERRGPFLFEHAPVRENCLNCHDPHGTVNEYSLKVSRPRLCYECHSIGHGGATTSGPGSAGTTASFGQACQNCHTNIHGSNSPAGALFHR